VAWAGAASFVLLLWAAVAWRYDQVVDDAFISFRYARNLARGAGLRFNPLDPSPVEGFTNLGWVLFLAPFERLGLDLPSVARAASALCACALLLLYVQRLRPALGRLDALLHGAFLAALPSFACWSTGGLETMAFSLALFVLFERVCLAGERSRAPGAALALVALLLLRADGWIWAAALLVSVALCDRSRRKTALRLLATAAPLCAAHFCWRRGVFDAWLPQSARAKVHPGALALARGLRWELSLLAQAPGLWLWVAAAAWTLVRRGGSRPRWVGAALSASAAALGYAALAGGDWMPWGRLLVPALPLAGAACAHVLAEWPRPLARALCAAGVALSLFSAGGLELAPGFLLQRLHFRWSDPLVRSENEVWEQHRGQVREWTQIGKALALVARPNESIALGAVGAQGYYSDLTIYDLHGLVTAVELPRPEPGARRSPGHDVVLDLEAYAEREPTYLMAFLTRADDPRSRLPADWRDGAAAIWNRLSFEVHALPPARGFPAESALALLRYRR
jgi:hypothetical protein